MIRRMIADGPLRDDFDRQLVGMQVQDMADGGMGSIKFYTGKPRSEAAYGEQIAEAAFRDSDGVPVSVTLSVDRAGCLFELDMFKADGSPLARYPKQSEFKIIRRDENNLVISVD